jgi:hypothetical protein
MNEKSAEKRFFCIFKKKKIIYWNEQWLKFQGNPLLTIYKNQLKQPIEEIMRFWMLNFLRLIVARFTEQSRVSKNVTIDSKLKSTSIHLKQTIFMHHSQIFRKFIIFVVACWLVCWLLNYIFGVFCVSFSSSRFHYYSFFLHRLKNNKVEINNFYE